MPIFTGERMDSIIAEGQTMDDAMKITNCSLISENAVYFDENGQISSFNDEELLSLLLSSKKYCEIETTQTNLAV